MTKIVILMGILSSIFGCNPKIDPNDTIKYFSLSEGGGMRRFSGYSYLVEETKDGRVHFLFNHGYPDEKEFTIDDHSVFDSLQQIVMTHKMYKYSGNYKPHLKVLDGKSWDFGIKYVSGVVVSAHGYMAGPSGYRAAFSEVIAYLNRWKETPVEVNGLASFDFFYGSTHYHIEPQGDHTLVTIEDETANRHEVVEKPMDMLEDLRVTAIVESLRENNQFSSDDPNSVPFKFDILFSQGEHYVYEAYDLGYHCHKTKVMNWFLDRWNIDFKLDK